MAKKLTSFPGEGLPILDRGPAEPTYTELKKVTKDNVTIEIIMMALTALAYRAGKPANAVRDMAEMGYEVTYAQVKGWSESKEYEEDYARIRDNFSRTSEAEMVREMRDTIHQASEAERLAIEHVVTSFEGATRITAKDASQAAFNLSRVKQNNVDKLQTLLGRPTQIIEDRSAEQAIKRLIAKRIIKPITEDSNDESGE